METQHHARRADRHQRAGTATTTSALAEPPCSSCSWSSSCWSAAVVWAVNYYAGCQRAPDGLEAAGGVHGEGGDTGRRRRRRARRTRASSAAAGSSATCCCVAPARPTRSAPATTSSRPGMTLDEVMTILTTAAEEDRDREAHDPARLSPHRRSPTRCSEAMGIPAETFLAAADRGDTSTRAAAAARGRQLSRGSCSPRPTRFPRRATADEVIQRLLDEFTDRTAQDLPWDRRERPRPHARTRS